MLLGLLAGLISLIRPTNAIVVLLFLFYDFSSFRDRFQILIRHKWQVLVMILLAFLCGYPSFYTGNRSVENGSSFPTETTNGFFGHNLYIGRVLFGFRKGLADLYTGHDLRRCRLVSAPEKSTGMVSWPCHLQ